MVEDAGLTAEPVERATVANPDAGSEQGIEAARAEEQKKKAAEAKARLEADKLERLGVMRPPLASAQDKLDRERATGEGMGPPPSNP